MIARKTLETQLRRFSFFREDETIRMHPDFDECFKRGYYAFLYKEKINIYDNVLIFFFFNTNTN